MRLWIHPEALKHGIGEADVGHAVCFSMSIDGLDRDRRLYLGPARDGKLLEVVTCCEVTATRWPFTR